MTDPVSMPAMPPEDAVAAGFAEFNRNPTLCVDIPDGGFTISAILETFVPNKF